MTRTQTGLAALALALAAGGAGYALRGAGGEAVHPADDGHAHGEGEAAHGEEGGTRSPEAREGELIVDEAQIRAAGIGVATVEARAVGAEVRAAGTLAPATDSTGKVTARTTGVVVRLVAKLGDQVRAGGPLAVIDSREVAEAQAAYQTAVRQEALARTTFERERALFEQKVTARADYDQARAAYDKARIDVQLGAQAVRALGVRPGSASRLFTLASPIAGQVATVSVLPGEFVSAERELFQIVNRTQVWAELRVAARDVALLRPGQQVTVEVQGAGHVHPARLAFLSPAVDPGSGSARAVAVVQNPDGELRIGQAVTARIATGGAGPLMPVVPRAAVQEVEGRQVVFVRTPTGFLARPVTLGAGSDAALPVSAGLRAGERVAVANSFVLKAELGKGEAEHAH